MDYSFSINELYLLGGILQVPSFIGVEDPFPGYLTEEIQECMEAARQSLSDQGYLKETEDGFLLDPDLIKAIHTMATSPKVVVAGKDNSSLFVFLDSGFGIKQESMPDGRIAISTNEDYTVMKEHIYSFLHLPAKPAASGNYFLIDSNILDDARNLSSTESKPPAYKEFLVNNGLQEDTAVTASGILSMNSYKGSLVILKRNDLSITPQISLAWVIGDQGGWVVEPLEGKKNTAMSWKPSSTSEIRSRIQTILETIK